MRAIAQRKAAGVMDRSREIDDAGFRRQRVFR